MIKNPSFLILVGVKEPIKKLKSGILNKFTTFKKQLQLKNNMDTGNEWSQACDLEVFEKCKTSFWKTKEQFLPSLMLFGVLMMTSIFFRHVRIFCKLDIGIFANILSEKKLSWTMLHVLSGNRGFYPFKSVKNNWFLMRQIDFSAIDYFL